MPRPSRNKPVVYLALLSPSGELEVIRHCDKCKAPAAQTWVWEQKVICFRCWNRARVSRKFTDTTNNRIVETRVFDFRDRRGRVELPDSGSKVTPPTTEIALTRSYPLELKIEPSSYGED